MLFIQKKLQGLKINCCIVRLGAGFSWFFADIVISAHRNQENALFNSSFQYSAEFYVLLYFADWKEIKMSRRVFNEDDDRKKLIQANHIQLS